MEESIIQRIKSYLSINGISNRSLALQLGMSEKTLNNKLNGTRGLDTDTLQKIALQFEDLNTDWLLTGKGEMLRSDIPTAILDRSGIPLYRTEAAAGFGNENFNIPEEDIEARYKIKELDAASFMLHVRGDSMAPTYNNGDVIAVQTIKDDRNIQWGKPHLVSSKSDGLLVKRIYDDQGDIIAVSDNPTYKPIHIQKEDITGIAIVKGFVRFENY